VAEEYALLGAGLDEFVATRLETQREVYGRELRDAGPEQRAEWLREWFLALQVEVSELAQTTGWKPWAVRETHGTVQMSKFLDESADVLIFLGNIWALAGVSGDDLAWAVEEKTARNKARQESGTYRGGV
jgi:dimeric dUTPase (all-alpha-NTP-PPase superfamily)